MASTTIVWIETVFVVKVHHAIGIELSFSSDLTVIPVSKAIAHSRICYIDEKAVMRMMTITSDLPAVTISGIDRAQAGTTEPTQILAPTVPPVEDAPGRGEIPQVSLHSAVLPTLYELERQPLEDVSPGLQRRYLSGTHSTFVEWIAKKGAKVPLHHHENEQITWITKGSCEVYSQGKKFVVKAGNIMIIPPNVPHEFVFTEDTIDIDIFTPQRQDWADGTAGYYAQK